MTSRSDIRAALGRRQRGMTLIELLVVIVIIALAAGLGVAWLGGGERDRLQTLTDRLARDWQLAAAVALGQQRVIGWRPVEGGYRFVAWEPARDGGAWVALSPDATALAARQWSRPVALEMASAPDEADGLAPWVAWWPPGEVIGGTLTLSSRGETRTLTVDALGVRELTAP
ncbi:prepilin-type N-terminal cleavage/methylation domain-containing protein [Salinicola halophilus]|uniref:prepilin-type N-terminal cleavage/methylation domain-containing protein n=1 Tax=Salinicola halophilus TaxID=184065 RepID=UPI000DA24456|nr:GspH/FimT family pseudopilin [Salinicola halophilus]